MARRQRSLRLGAVMALLLTAACGSDASSQAPTASPSPSAQQARDARDAATIRRWRAILVAAHDREPVFHNAVQRIGDMLVRSGVARDDIAWLSAAARDPQRRPTQANLGAAFAPRTPPADEACFVYLTSHGDERGIEVIAGRDTFSLAPAELGRLLDRHCGRQPTVVIVSACHSGVYQNQAVVAPHRILLTAARRDRTSFGCSVDNEFSFYDSCFIAELDAARGWPQLAVAVNDCVRRREREERVERPSLPTSSFGTATRKLPLVGRRAPD